MNQGRNLSSYRISVTECLEINTSTFYKLFVDPGRDLGLVTVRSTNTSVETSLSIGFYLPSLSPWTPHSFGFPLLGLVLLLQFYQYSPSHYGNVWSLLISCAPVRSAVHVSRLLVLSHQLSECLSLSDCRENEANLGFIPLAFGFSFLLTLPVKNCGTQLIIPETSFVSANTKTIFACGNLKL